MHSVWQWRVEKKNNHMRTGDGKFELTISIDGTNGLVTRITVRFDNSTEWTFSTSLLER